jgi:hypothetical protein
MDFVVDILQKHWQKPLTRFRVFLCSVTFFRFQKTLLLYYANTKQTPIPWQF